MTGVAGAAAMRCIRELGNVYRCCIDKTSSAELSEAINSMYEWYEKSDICYAYLEDVPASSPQPDVDLFMGARWFTRGWTLQELIAPRAMEFYAQDWTEIGTKASLHSLLHKRTGINEALLLYKQTPSEYPIAQRMSWASERQTTRSEDRAYCLLGLFGVNMPLLYGEGSRAFLRLQEEILRRYEDYSIFLWTADSHNALSDVTSFTFLAPNASSFRDEKPFLSRKGVLRWSTTTTCPPSMLKHGLARHDPKFSWVTPTAAAVLNNASFDPPSITSRGLRITLLVTDKIPDLPHKTILAWTFCLHKEEPSEGYPPSLICIRYALHGNGTLVRLQAIALDCIDPILFPKFHAQELYLPLTVAPTSLTSPPQSRRRPRELRVAIIPPLIYDAREVNIWPPSADSKTPWCTAHGWSRDVDPRELSFILIRLRIWLHEAWRWVLVCVGETSGGRIVCDVGVSDVEELGSREYLALQGEFQQGLKNLTDRTHLTFGTGESLSVSLRPFSERVWVEVSGSSSGSGEGGGGGTIGVSQRK